MEKSGLEKFGIKLLKPSQSFASNQKRFSQQFEEVLGPGSYHHDLEWV